MKISFLDWNRKNVEHIAKHQVSQEEVEEVVFENEPLITKGRQGRYYIFGKTKAGRYLFLVLVLLGKRTARVVTARQMVKRERQFYQQRR